MAGPVAFDCFPPLRQQTGSSIPERCLMFLRLGRDSVGRGRPGKHVGDTINPSRTALPVCCHHGGNSQNRLDQPQTGGIHRQTTTASHHYTIALTNSCYSRSVRLVKTPSPHRQRSRPCSVNSQPLSSPTSGRLTSSISGPLTSLRGVSNRI